MAMRLNDKRRRFATLLPAMFALAAAARQPSGTSAARDLSNWTTVEYGVSGGIAFNVHSVTVTRDGALTAADRRLGMDVEGRAPDDLLARLNAFLKTARDAKQTPAMPDAIGTSLVATAGGRKYDLEVTPDVAAAMESAWKDLVSRAIVGTWSQSGWKPCQPTDRMAATDLDTPIEDLTFRADGTFSLTWQGGGARTTGAPHVTLPDYSGTYSVTAPMGAIRLRVASGMTPPRDFDGDGSFQVAKGQLTLKGVWFGTNKAPRRPDFCDLTFGRKPASREAVR